MINRYLLTYLLICLVYLIARYIAHLHIVNKDKHQINILLHICISVVNERCTKLTQTDKPVGFNNRNLFLTAKLLKQGYRYHKIRKTFTKLYHRHPELIVKYKLVLVWYLIVSIPDLCTLTYLKGYPLEAKTAPKN